MTTSPTLKIAFKVYQKLLSRLFLKPAFSTVSLQILTFFLTFSLFQLIIPANLLVTAEGEHNLKSLKTNWVEKTEQAGEKTQVLVSQISYNQANSLRAVWPIVSQLFAENEEMTLQLNSRIEMEKISLPMAIEVKKEDTLPAVGQRWQKTREQILNSLSENKKGEEKFWIQKVGEINPLIVSSFQQQGTLLANLDSLELEKLIQPENRREISVESITVSRSNLNTQTSKNLAKIAQEKDLQEKTVDLTQTSVGSTGGITSIHNSKPNSDTNSVENFELNTETNFQENLQTTPKGEANLENGSEEIPEPKDDKLKPKVKLRPENVQIAQKTASLEEKLQEKQNKQVQSSSSTNSTFSQNLESISSSSASFVNTSFSEYSSQQASSQGQKSEQSFIQTNSSSSSLASLPTETTLTVRDILELKEETNLAPKQRKIGENMFQESKTKWFDHGVDDFKVPKKVASIETFIYQNPFYISPEEEAAKNAQIEAEKQQALEHNKKFKQYYSIRHYQEMVKSKIDPDPSIYPFSVIDEQNRELSAAEIQSLKNEILNPTTGLLESILNFGSLKAQARGLNNTAFPLLIYNWDNNGMVMDVPYGNTTNGNQLVTYYRQGGGNQLFWFDNISNRIISSLHPDKCLDISAGNYNNGTAVQIWDCHSMHNQQWFFKGAELKPLNSPGFCLDAMGGLNPEARLALWECHGGINQKWVAGENNFGRNFEVSIHAAATDFISTAPTTGHVLISYRVNGNLVNTQSSWPEIDNVDMNYNAGYVERYNNIADYDSVYVDKPEDWYYALNPASHNFRTKSSHISKRLSDIYRFNSGYRWGLSNNGLDHVNYFFYPTGGTTNQHNCSSFSTVVWNNIMDDLGYPRIYPRREWLPSFVYDVL